MRRSFELPGYAHLIGCEEVVQSRSKDDEGVIRRERLPVLGEMKTANCPKLDTSSVRALHERRAQGLALGDGGGASERRPKPG